MRLSTWHQCPNSVSIQFVQVKLQQHINAEGLLYLKTPSYNMQKMSSLPVKPSSSKWMQCIWFYLQKKWRKCQRDKKKLTGAYCYLMFSSFCIVFTLCASVTTDCRWLQENTKKLCIKKYNLKYSNLRSNMKCFVWQPWGCKASPLDFQNKFLDVSFTINMTTAWKLRKLQHDLRIARQNVAWLIWRIL